MGNKIQEIGFIYGWDMDNLCLIYGFCIDVLWLRYGRWMVERFIYGSDRGQFLFIMFDGQ